MRAARRHTTPRPCGQLACWLGFGVRGRVTPSRPTPLCRRLPRDVLTWVMFGLAVWLGLGVITAWLVFGASVSGSRRSRERD